MDYTVVIDEDCIENHVIIKRVTTESCRLLRTTTKRWFCITPDIEPDGPYGDDTVPSSALALYHTGQSSG